MFSKFKQNVQTLFLDKNSDVEIQSDQKYHIILSPTLYWIKKEKLPLKYIHEVKKIAPTLFEDILPEGEYSYFIYKEEESFVLFAYEDKQILALLREKGIAPHNIASLSFAQTACNINSEALKIDEEHVLVKKEGVVVVLPASWFLGAQTLRQKHLIPSKYTIKLEQFSHIIDSKTLYKIGALLGGFIVVVMMEYLVYYGELQKFSEEKEQIFKFYKLKPTLMQNSAILSHYKSIATKQEKLREYISYILKAKLMKNEKIAEISYENKKLRVVFEGVKKSALKRILSNFYKNKVTLDVKDKADQLVVEVVL